MEKINYSLTKGIFPKLYQHYDKQYHLCDKKEFFKNSKIKLDKETGNILLEIGERKINAQEVYHYGENNTTNIARDYRNDIFITKDGDLCGPYATINPIKKNGKITYIARDRKDKIIHVDDKTLDIKNTGWKYISQHCLINTDDKYAYAEDNIPQTEFIFDNRITFVKTYTDEKDNKLLAIGTKDRFVIYNKNSKEILYECDKPVKDARYEKDMLLINFENSFVLVGKEKISTFEGYECLGIKDNYYVMKNSQNKVGLFDRLGKQILPCVYDNIYPPEDYLYYSNPDPFVKIQKDGKMGLFNVETKKIEIQPFCQDIFTQSYKHAQSRELGDVRRFFFQAENCKFGLVNNKGHILIEPILSRSQDVAQSNYEKGYYRLLVKGKDKDLYVNPDLKNVFLDEKIKYTRTFEDKSEIKNTSSSPQYSSEQVAGGAGLGFLIDGPIGASFAADYMRNKTSSKTKKSYKVEYRTSEYEIEPLPANEIAEYVHSDLCDLPINKKDVKLKSNTMSIKEYLNKYKDMINEYSQKLEEKRNNYDYNQSF